MFVRGNFLANVSRVGGIHRVPQLWKVLYVKRQQPHDPSLGLQGKLLRKGSEPRPHDADERRAQNNAYGRHNHRRYAPQPRVVPGPPARALTSTLAEDTISAT